MKYHYLVAYSFNGGGGRAFVQRDVPITSREDVEGIEEAIKQQGDRPGAIITSFTLLRVDKVTTDGNSEA